MASDSTLMETTSPPPTTTPPPLCLPAPPISTPASVSKRPLPPPHWSDEEMVALIKAYKDKWYSLRRGNLKATHWQEIADEVVRRCPNASPAKTAVHCRHRMEKLRRRYRSDIKRRSLRPRCVPTCPYFRMMDDLEKGPVAAKVENSDSREGDDDDNDEKRELYGEVKNGGANMRSIHKPYGNGVGVGVGVGNSGESSSGGGSAFRVRVPPWVSVAQPGMRYYGRVEQPNLNVGASASPSPGFSPSQGFGPRVLRDGNVATSVLGMSDKERGKGREWEKETEKEKEKEKEKDPWKEMVGAIKVFGDGFLRMEKMKMEMTREIETLRMEMAREFETIRMEMEMKRTEMILESQQRIAEAFANALADKRTKKMKIIHSPDA